MFATHVRAFMYFEVVNPLHIRDKKLLIVIHKKYDMSPFLSWYEKSLYDIKSHEKYAA